MDTKKLSAGSDKASKILLACFWLLIASVVVWDFGFNAKWNDKLLEPYGVYGEGVHLAEAPYSVESDISETIHRHITGKNFSVDGYYAPVLRIIKINEGEYNIIPHELGHHYWWTKLNESQRDEFCEYSADVWQQYSYDGSCEEGYAEWFGDWLKTMLEAGEI